MSESELSEARTKLHEDLGKWSVEKIGIDQDIRCLQLNMEGALAAQCKESFIGSLEYKLQMCQFRIAALNQAIEQACIAFNMAYQETGTKT